MKSFKQHVAMMSEAPLEAKGWVNARAKKAEVASLKAKDFYHVTMVTQDPEKYGLTKKKIIKYFKSIKALDPKGEFQKLATGENDMWPAVDSMAMANGWVRFTADTYAAEITAESWEDVHAAAKFILEHKGLERVAETFTSPPRQGVHLRVRRKGKSEVASKTLIKDAGDFTKWAFGSVADPDKALKKKDGGLTSIGSTMARFREDVVVEGCGCGCNECSEEEITEAEYQGKKVTLNEPFRTPGKNKKFAVYTKNESGKVVIVRFGDPNMEIRRDDAKARANFRSRHSCDDDPGPKWKARYWSCYQWRAGAPVDD